MPWRAFPFASCPAGALGSRWPEVCRSSSSSKNELTRLLLEIPPPPAALYRGGCQSEALQLCRLAPRHVPMTSCRSRVGLPWRKLLRSWLSPTGFARASRSSTSWEVWGASSVGKANLRQRAALASLVRAYDRIPKCPTSVTAKSSVEHVLGHDPGYVDDLACCAHKVYQRGKRRCQLV